MSRARRSGFLFAAAAILCLYAGAQDPAGPTQPAAGSAGTGARLFAGSVRFANGGPSCASCHAAATIPFPNGGTLGPDLTGTAAKFGPTALGPVLASLPFPAMVPLFHDHPLSAGEQADLAAFFEAVAGAPKPRSLTALLVGVSCAGGAVLLGLAGAFWRRRLTGVRRALVGGKRAAPGGRRP